MAPGEKILSIDIKLPIEVSRNIKGLGKHLFDDAFTYFNLHPFKDGTPAGLTGVKGWWLRIDDYYSDYGGISVNLQKFINAKLDGLSDVEAAFETVTGGWIKSHNWNNVEIKDMFYINPQNPIFEELEEVKVIFKP